jgi:hypothetical protein
MNRRNFLRNLVGAVLIGIARPLDKLESRLEINSRPVVCERKWMIPGGPKPEDGYYLSTIPETLKIIHEHQRTITTNV